jgi:hypothetical protein
MQRKICLLIKEKDGIYESYGNFGSSHLILILSTLNGIVGWLLDKSIHLIFYGETLAHTSDGMIVDAKTESSQICHHDFDDEY